MHVCIVFQFSPRRLTKHDRVRAVFDSPRSTLLGLMSAIYSLGAIVVLPVVPWVSDNWGRRWAIVLGSVLMVIGAAIQAAAQNCSLPPLVPVLEAKLMAFSDQLQCLFVDVSSWALEYLSLSLQPPP